MIKETKEIYNAVIFNKICKKFDLIPDNVKLLNGFESFIYEFSKNNQDYILRVTHSLHRNEDQIKAEVDWVNYLADGGVSVSRAVLSPAGNLVERVDSEDTYFLAIAFGKAPGRHIKKEDRKPETYENLGRIIGKMHRLTKDYKPIGNKRSDWFEQDSGLINFIPEDQTIVKQKYLELMNFINALSKDRDSYGLIHTDAHFGNIFIDNGKLTVFDFDDSVYKWFISDIAIVLFYGVMGVPKGHTREEFAELVFTNFMKGYKQENKLDQYWIELMPKFLKLREMVLYAVIYMGFDVENLQDPWCKWYLDGRKEKIESDIPYLDLDFDKILKTVKDYE